MWADDFERELKRVFGGKIHVLPQTRSYSVGIFRSHNGSYYGQYGNYYGEYATAEEAQCAIFKHRGIIAKYNMFIAPEKYIARVVGLDEHATFVYTQDLPVAKC